MAHGSRLTDGASLTIPAGIHVLENDSLTIYGQTSGTGTLTIDGVESNYAGIGGEQYISDRNPNSGTITINGGTLNVTAGSGACAVGSGSSGNGGTITINGGTVTANGGYSGAAIGTAKTGADYGNAAITINGGKVSVSGGEYASGIDAGKNVLTLGWTDEDDFIANSKTYSGIPLRIKDGQMMTDNAGNYYSGTLTNDEKLAIKGKTLYPVPDAHTITIGTVTGGSVTADRTLVRSGKTVTITAGTGYRIVSAKFNESDINITDGAGTFTMPNEEVTITATVEKIPHTITIGTVTGGSVTPDKTTAGIDDTVTLTLTPEGDTTLFSLKAAYTDSDNTEHSIAVTGSGSSYTFTMPNADVTVTAAFSDGL
ncbi:MAG: hypothetical protein IJQ58_08985, partial [Synergistaceae bacterium]|nr:hypothetical protein [Synergistaceae bacterium]